MTRMSAFKHDNFNERLAAAANARKAALEKFRARPGPDDPAVLERQAAQKAVAEAREARIAERKAARAAEAARQAAETAARAAQQESEAAEQAARQADAAGCAPPPGAHKKSPGP